MKINCWGVFSIYNIFILHCSNLHSYINPLFFLCGYESTLPFELKDTSKHKKYYYDLSCKKFLSKICLNVFLKIKIHLTNKLNQHNLLLWISKTGVCTFSPLPQTHANTSIQLPMQAFGFINKSFNPKIKGALIYFFLCWC